MHIYELCKKFREKVYETQFLMNGTIELKNW